LGFGDLLSPPPLSAAMPSEIFLLPGMTEVVNPMSDKYEVMGADMQVLHLSMKPQEKIVTEPGLMLYMQPDVKASVDCGQCLGRCCSCNPLIMATYINSGGADAVVGLTPSIPAKVLPLPVSGDKAYRCKSGSFMASQGDASLGFDIDCNPLTCCCGGQGCCRQVVKGDGVGYLVAMGTLVKKTLAAEDTIVVDTNSLVAWESTAKLGVRMAGLPCTVCCSGEGCCNTTVSGPGEVYIQSMSWESFQKQMMVIVQKKKDGSMAVSVGGSPPEGEAMKR